VHTGWRYEACSLLSLLAHLALESGTLFQRVLLETRLPKVHEVDVQMEALHTFVMWPLESSHPDFDNGAWFPIPLCSATHHTTFSIGEFTVICVEL
jgi:hypothetical protein